MSRKRKNVAERCAKKRGNRESNEVLTFGCGDMSQLGLGAGTRERKNPAVVKVLEGLNIVAVKAGAMHNVVLLENGCVYTWGCNDDHGNN